MRKMLFVAAIAPALGWLALAGPAAAQGFGQVQMATAPTPAPPAGAQPGTDVSGVTVTGKRIPESQKDPKEILCHEEAVLGSRFPVKVCAQRQEFAERRREDQEQLREWVAVKPLKSN